jgi:hypothetical protein
MLSFLRTLLLSLAPFLAWAQTPVTAADTRAVREIIEAQLDAFQRDDAQRAFSYAAPGIREQFGSAENFMQMVQTSYAVVYRPRTVKFEAFEAVDDEVLQPVRLTDVDGQAWLALYSMERQPDGNWRISGCRLARLVERET